MDEDQAEVKIGRQIGERLKAIADQMSISQGQLAYKTKLSSGQVSMLLNGGIQNPGIGTVLRVAQALNLTLDQLVGLSPLPVVEPIVNDDFESRLRKLEETVRTALPALALQNEAEARALEQAAGTKKRSRAKSRRP